MKGSAEKPQAQKHVMSAAEKEVWENRVKDMKNIEDQINQDWEHAHIYEADAPADGDKSNHYLVTFPFPYMNGRLHLGHIFTATKAEFSARYQRMKGKNVLFPFGFHCTGTPIKASAEKLARELESGHVEKASDAHLKSKAASKTHAGAGQVEIMHEMGVPEEEIPKFTNPEHWIEYFPPLGMSDLKKFGACVDWRRSFITTSKNPYFDAFVRWQFRHLYKANLIKFGKRPTICTFSDRQPCMDHDRSKGEAVAPQEYTLIKLHLENASTIDARFDKPTFLLAATLRPETMVGQTNYWIKPGVQYDVVLSKDEKELYVAGTRSVNNLFAQDLVQSSTPVFQINSNQLIGAVCTQTRIDHPIRGLPMETIKMTVGTAIVTSVPSDAPADYQALEDLKKNAAMREKYHIDPTWLQIEPIPIIETQKYGKMSSVAVLEQVMADNTLKMTKPEKLEYAKEICYKEGFYKGIMIAGPYAGRKVQEAKEEMKAAIVSEGGALTYYEPASEVISRSDEECVVMYLDQWYLDYGQKEWKESVTNYFTEHVETYHPAVREKFLYYLNWLGPWACSRQFGLGTRLPFAEEYLIDSLSDSTIYTAYYTIAHILQGNLDGSVHGAIPPEKVNDEFFEYIFKDGPMPTSLPEDLLKKVKHEFEFWYPVNCRVSGKDLIPNHLTMFLYNHAAIFDQKYWPLGIRANGHLKLNSEKMSKSTGNFLTLADAMTKYSVSALRIGFADAGDGDADANFEDDTAVSAMARFNAFISIVENTPKNMRDEPSVFADELFDAQISRAIIESDSAFGKMNFKAGLKACFFDLSNDYSAYCLSCEECGQCRKLRQRFIETFVLCLAPIAPHFSEFIWKQKLGHSDSVVAASFPKPNTFNPQIFFIERFIKKTSDCIAYGMKSARKSKEVLNSLGIFIQTEFTDVQMRCLDLIRSHYNEAEKSVDEKVVIAEAGKDELLKTVKPNVYMPFLRFYIQASVEFGSFLLNKVPSIDQVAVINNNKQTFMRQLSSTKVTEISVIVGRNEADPHWDDKTANDAQVYIPQVKFIHKE